VQIPPGDRSSRKQPEQLWRCDFLFDLGAEQLELRPIQRLDPWCAESRRLRPSDGMWKGTTVPPCASLERRTKPGPPGNPAQSPDRSGLLAGSNHHDGAPVNRIASRRAVWCVRPVAVSVRCRELERLRLSLPYQRVRGRHHRCQERMDRLADTAKEQAISVIASDKRAHRPRS
jgi:hypothetical protein